MKRALSLTVVLALLMSAAPRAQEAVPLITDVRAALIGRDTVSVRLQSGQDISGSVTYRTADGFYVARPPRAPLFIRYDCIEAILDPVSGAVEANVRRTPPDRLRRNGLIQAGIILGALTVLTRGAFPVCLFADCR